MNKEGFIQGPKWKLMTGLKSLSGFLFLKRGLLIDLLNQHSLQSRQRGLNSYSFSNIKCLMDQRSKISGDKYLSRHKHEGDILTLSFCLDGKRNLHFIITFRIRSRFSSDSAYFSPQFNETDFRRLYLPSCLDNV